MQKKSSLIISLALCFIFQAFNAIADNVKIVQVVDSTLKPLPNAAILVPGAKYINTDQSKVVIEQINKQFSPQLTIVKTGSDVIFSNNDKTRHHVYSFSPAKPFELPLYASSEIRTVNFDTTGTVYLGCNIHDNMKATLIITDTEVFGITDSKGLSVIAAIQGDWPSQMWVWHLQSGSDEPVSYAVKELANGTSQIEVDFIYKLEAPAPKKLTLKERLEKYKNQ